MGTTTRIRLRFGGSLAEFNAIEAGTKSRMRQLTSFMVSLGLHGGLIAGLVNIPQGPRQPEKPIRMRVYKVLDLKKEPLLYWAPDPSKLPNVSSTTPIGESQTFRGAQQSATEKIVVQQVSPEPAKQLVWQPDKPSRLQADTPLPNLLAIQQEPIPKPLATPPVLAASSNSPRTPTNPPISPEIAMAQLPTVKPKPKPLNLPASRPKLPLPATMVQDTPPELASAQQIGVAGVATTNLGAIPKRPPTYRPGANRRGDAGAGNRQILDDVPTLDTAGTGAAVTAALIGLNPAETLTALPDGSRGAAFSRADRVGEPSAPKSGIGPAVPGVAIAGTSRPSAAPSVAPRPASPPSSPKSGSELRIPPSVSGISAPLRPAARSLPRVIEARFRDRIVYTLVIPKPNQPQYIADWTVWFAERTPEASAASSMKAPAPLRKSIKEEDAAKKSIAAEGWVQLSGFIGTDGKISSVVALQGRYPIVAAHAAEDLMTWEFRPAMRNGVAVEVEVVIEVPFQIR